MVMGAFSLRHVGDEAAHERLGRAGERIVLRPWFAWLSRVGLAMKGAMYLTIGVCAGLAAAKAGGSFLNLPGTVTAIAEHLGYAALALMIAGNLGYAAFKTVAALCDTDRKGHGFVGICKRLNMLAKAVIHAGVAVVAVRVLLGYVGPDTTGDTVVQRVASDLMWARPATWLLYVLGLYLVGSGFMQFYMIYTAYFRRRLQLDHLSVPMFRLITVLGRFGYAARGLVAWCAGSSLLLAAWWRDPSRAHGLGGVLKWLGEQAYVPYLFALVASGLVAYGLFEILLARYRHLSVVGLGADREPLSRSPR
jgi:hypothetical protein